MLRFDSVSFSYTHPGGELALRDVSFSLERGEMLAVVGANGSGKSTLVRLANGLLTPLSGSVVVDGIDTTDRARARDVRATVGVVFQRPDDQIVATSVEDEVAFGPENLGLDREEIRRRVQEAIAAVGLVGLERREPHLLSGGQKQRLAIAGALAMGPRYLVLDEPTSMLDPKGKAEVRAVLDELRLAGHGLVNVTHDLGEAMRCDRAMVLHRGEVVFVGDPEALVDSDRAMEEWGLEPTPLMRLARGLSEAGVDVPSHAASVDDIAEALWR